MLTNPRVSIFYLSVGSGHQIAASSISDALKLLPSKIHVRTVDPYTDAIEIFPAVMERLQAASIILAPNIYDSLWRRGIGTNVSETLNDVMLSQNLIIDELRKHPADIIITTHGLLCAAVASLKRHEGLKSDLYGTITDYGLHTLWPLDNVTGYFVPHEEIRQSLIYQGVDPNLIKATGIPVNQEYKKHVRSGKSQYNPLRVLMLMGGVKSGAYIGMQQYFINLLRAITNLNITNIQFTIVTGNQRKLKKKLEEFTTNKVSFPLKITGFVDNMHNVMTCHDVIITKPGGLTIAEALASSMCIILSKPGPGQESANVDFLARHGAALKGESPDDVAKILKTCIDSPLLIKETQQKARELGRPNAADEIANHIENHLIMTTRY